MSIKSDVTQSIQLKDVSLPDGSANQNALAEKLGVLDTWGVRREASKEAKRALVNLERSQIKAEENIGIEAIGIAERQIRTTMVAQGMSSLGAASIHLNSAINAVDKALTVSCKADLVSHILARDAGRYCIDELMGKGSITAAEAEAVREMSDADAARDIQKSRERMGLAKNAVDQLYKGVLTHVEHGSKNIQGG